jgi:hypothetical protein
VTTITEVVARDVRFPTSENLAGSDAMNQSPDYSAAYAVLKTDTDLEGHGLTFTIGRGNELCVAAIEALAPLVVGRTLEEGSITARRSRRASLARRRCGASRGASPTPSSGTSWRILRRLHVAPLDKEEPRTPFGRSSQYSTSRYSGERRCRTRRNSATSVRRSMPEDSPTPPAVPCNHL